MLRMSRALRCGLKTLFWGFVSAGFPSVSRNREAYQSIDQQDESTGPANPFNQAQDSKPAARTY